VWDVAPDGSAQGLVTRGVYRMGPAAPSGTSVSFQLNTTAYRFEAGHTLRVEVTGNDAPYLLANRQASDIEVSDLRLVLPEHRPGGAAPDPVDEVDEVDQGGGGIGAGWVVGGTAAGVILGLGAWAWLRARRGGASADAPPAAPDAEEPPGDA
jgi:hypothetical protein